MPTTSVAESISVLSSNYTAVLSDKMLVFDTTGENITCTLPANPFDGQVLYIKKPNAANTLTIDGNGHLIDAASTLAVNATNQATALHFSTATGVWYIRSGFTPSNTRMGQTTLDFGFSGGGEGDTAAATISATWVASTSIIICQIGAVATADHDPEDAVIESIQARAINIIPGVSFDIEALAPGGTWGRYVALYQGLISRSST